MQLPEVSLYIYEAGKVRYISAKTRSWEQAEKAAQAERDLWDPEKIALQRIAEGEAAKSAALVPRLYQWGSERSVATLRQIGSRTRKQIRLSKYIDRRKKELRHLAGISR